MKFFLSTLLPRAVLSAVLALSVACAVNPVTGEKELSLLSQEQEIAIGEKQYHNSQQTQGGLYYLDPALQNYINDIGQRLASVSHRPDLPYEFVVLNSSVPNAWALPGGKVAINRGLLIHLEDEAELAAVLGHEIVHAAAGHGAAQMSQGQLLSIGAQLAAIASQAGGYGDLGGQAAQLGGAAWMAKYGRDDELESDAFGMEYMSKVGYDPMGAVELQKTFVRLSNNQQADFVSGLFASHPPSQERVKANQKKAAALPAGKRNKDRYQRQIAQLKKDQPAYEAQERAMKAIKDKNYNEAMAFIDRAIEVQPRESEFWEIKGQLLEAKKAFKQAEVAYSRAIKYNPGFFRPVLLRGLLHFDQGDHFTAKTDLQHSYKILPTQVAADRLNKLK